MKLNSILSVFVVCVALLFCFVGGVYGTGDSADAKVAAVQEVNLAKKSDHSSSPAEVSEEEVEEEIAEILEKEAEALLSENAEEDKDAEQDNNVVAKPGRLRGMANSFGRQLLNGLSKLKSRKVAATIAALAAVGMAAFFGKLFLANGGDFTEGDPAGETPVLSVPDDSKTVFISKNP